MSRPKIIIAFFCALLFFPLEAVYACSAAPPVIEVTCANGEQGSIAYDGRQKGLSINFDPAKVMYVVQDLCGVPFPADSLRFAEIVAEHTTHHVYFHANNNLHLTSYRPEVIADFEWSNLNLLTCKTVAYEVLGDWIVHYTYRPPYCENELLTLSICGATSRIAFYPFMLYLLLYPSPVAFTYLAALVVGIIAFGRWLWRQRSLSFFKPTVSKVLLFVLACPTLLYLTVSNDFYLDIGTLGWAFMVWGIVSIISVLLRFIGTFPRHTETPIEQ